MPVKRTKKQATGLQSTSLQHSNGEPAAAKPVSLEEIKYRAYEIYRKRGEQPGHELDDWLQAERELQSAPLPA